MTSQNNYFTTLPFLKKRKKTINRIAFLVLIIFNSLSLLKGQSIYSKHYTTQNGLANNVVFDMLQDEKGYLWLATKNGLSRFNGSTFKNFSTADGLSDNTITHLEFNNGQLVCFFEKKPPQKFSANLFRKNQKNVKLDYTTDIEPTKPSINYHWDTLNNQIFWQKSKDNAIDLIAFLNISSKVTKVFTDDEKHLWISTEGSGIYWLNLSPFTNYGNESGLTNTFINDVAEDKNGNIWTGTKDGFFEWNGQKWQQKSSKLEVWQFGKNEQNELYASTDEGIFKINPTITNCISTEKTATSFLIDEFGNFNLLHDGYFWIYKDCETKPNKWVAELDNLKAGYSLFEDNRERLWVGTEQGVFIYENLTVHNISEDNNLPSNLVNDITQDSLGDVWLATENGLAQLRADSIIRVFTVTDGLLSNQCRKICVNPFGGIWIATPRGLHFLFEDKIIPYNESTGLSSSDVNALFVDSNNHLWVATSNGIAKQKLIKNPILALSPRVDIQNFWSNDKPIELPNLPIIPFDNYIKIDFDAITFSNTNEIVFEYRLNKNKPWKPTQDRSLTLTDLREGEYEFQLRAKKINSEWSNIETFSFRIAPPFWRANWFLFLLFSTLVIFSVAVIIFFKKQEQQKTAFHQQLAELELNALQAQMNPHFIFNALNAIQDFVVRNDANEANKYLSKFSKLMRLFLESSKSKYITLAEEIRLLKLYISLEKLCYEEHFDYTFEVDETLDEDIEIPSMFIQPFVENAIRHGLFNKKEKGFLRLSFKEKNEQLVCEITDNGIGRAKAKKIATTKNKRHKSRGLEIISQRQAVFSNFNNETIQFSIKDLEDENGQANGTKVTIAFEIE